MSVVGKERGSHVRVWSNTLYADVLLVKTTEIAYQLTEVIAVLHSYK
jgi:hypothetical protein